MRNSRKTTRLSRESILEHASVLFRERGLAAVSVADLMTAAGMTHGGFYRHFSSKDALVAEAIATAFSERVAVFDCGANQHGPEAELDAFIRRYLSLTHVANPGRGCPIAALGGEIARQGDMAKMAFSTGRANMVDRIASGLPAQLRDRKSRALFILAVMVGAVVTARADVKPSSQTRVLADVQKRVEILRNSTEA